MGKRSRLETMDELGASEHWRGRDQVGDDDIWGMVWDETAEIQLRKAKYGILGHLKYSGIYEYYPREFSW